MIDNYAAQTAYVFPKKKEKEQVVLDANFLIGRRLESFYRSKLNRNNKFLENNILFENYVNHWIYKHQKEMNKDVLKYLTEKLNYKAIKNKNLIGRL